MKKLTIVCGVPNSGKTTYAEMEAASNGGIVHSADHYFEKKDEHGNVIEYNFDFGKLHQAHSQCRKLTEASLKSGIQNVYVANTNTREKEIKPYRNMGLKYGYTVFVVAVGRYHEGGDNNHNVPLDIINKMRKRIRENFKF